MNVATWLVLAFLAISPAYADTLTGRVVSIADGDTLTVLDAQNTQHKIRLAEIDAPEIGHGFRKPGQPYGQNARQALAAMCAGQQANVEVVDTDRYRRSVGRVQCRGRDVNRDLVSTGMAWAYTKYARRPEIFAAEQEARAARVGLWLDATPTPPWMWRKMSR